MIGMQNWFIIGEWAFLKSIWKNQIGVVGQWSDQIEWSGDDRWSLQVCRLTFVYQPGDQHSSLHKWPESKWSSSASMSPYTSKPAQPSLGNSQTTFPFNCKGEKVNRSSILFMYVCELWIWDIASMCFQLSLKTMLRKKSFSCVLCP